MRAGTVTCSINTKNKELKKKTMYADWLEVFVNIVCKKKKYRMCCMYVHICFHLKSDCYKRSIYMSVSKSVIYIESLLMLKKRKTKQTKKHSFP